MQGCRLIVAAPAVKADKHGAVVVLNHLPVVVLARAAGLALAEERPVPPCADFSIRHTYDRPGALHRRPPHCKRWLRITAAKIRRRGGVSNELHIRIDGMQAAYESA